MTQACGNDRGVDDGQSAGGAHLGGAVGSGGSSAGGTSQGGAGGTLVAGGGARIASGGVSVGGAPGGTTGSGAMSGGGAGGSSTGGGPASSGGTGGAGTGGSGSGGTGNGGSTACDLPASFRWTSSGPLIAPKSTPGHDFVSIKDPTIVQYEGTYHVFATVFDAAPASRGWKSVYLNFTDLAQAGAAPQTYMGNWATGNTVAPQVFYFRPHDKWYLVYQWGARYSTNDDIRNPGGWSAPRQLLRGEPKGALDYWVICNDVSCHLFFSADDGKLYRSKTSIANFPAFDGYEVVMSDPQPGRLFEASNVYKVQGTDRYLLIVEAYAPRYFRSWTASSLDGPWTRLADTQSSPFAGAANVTFQGADWTDDVSHGELIRAGHDETMALDACRLQFLYQGVNPSSGVREYDLLPYRLGLLTAAR